MTELLNEAEQIFFASLDVSDALRSRFVETQCARNQGLRKIVEDLLSAHQKNAEGGFILDHSLAANTCVADDTAVVAEKVGDSIGRYTLLERIGEGGMGVVYMARQTETIHRHVALKIIKLGMDTRQVVARFEIERQAMAMFDHPNIARILDAGATETGRPYIVMELVRGTRITKHVVEHQLELAAKLKLFRTVCQAAQHAHQKGIIHRDLKPSNILVKIVDGVPTPKIIDFGIAKALGSHITSKTMLTRYSSMVGTPQYMSPEQAEMSGMDVDTRSDIFSLGIILYELLTGTTPLDEKRLQQMNPAELFDTIRNSTFEKPSNRLSRLDSSPPAGESLAHRHDLAKQIHGPLDWIVMKALSHDRLQRYATAAEFGADVQRYLDGNIVEAAAPSQLYRLTTRLKKHRKTVAAVSVVAFSLLLSTIACSMFAISMYRSQQDLNSAITELKSKNDRLMRAENTIREFAETKVYESAVNKALADFSFERYRDQTRIVREFMKQQRPRDNARSNVSTSLVTYKPDPRELLDLEYREWVQHAIRPLVKVIDDKRSGGRGGSKVKVTQNGQSSHPNSRNRPAQSGHVPTQEDLDEQLRDLMIRKRPEFYRMLLREYRNRFGRDDSRVADALDLLAASKIENGEPLEAEGYLRESLDLRSRVSELDDAVNRKESIQATRRLLEFCADR